ncbi:MAG: hypothetical protein VW600_16980 [Ferrovibrio sp.]
MRKLVAAAVLLLGLTACVTQSLDTQRASQYKHVGLLTAMDDRFSVTSVGSTAFGNSRREDKLDLGADAMMTASALQALSGRYQVTDLSRYRRAFLDQPKHWPGEKGLFAKDAPMVPDVVRTLMGGEKLDAYILVTPAYGSVRGTNQSVAGIGVVQVNSLFGGSSTMLHAGYIVSVIDGVDYSLVADMRAFPTGESIMSSFSPVKSALSLPNIAVAPQTLDAPAQHREPLVTLLKLLIADTLPQTLRQAKLIE